MAKYQVDWVESKGPDWKVAKLVNLPGDVSINRTNKKGEVFPGFDEIMPGKEIEGEFWNSPSGKGYLFPPKAPKSSFKGNSMAVVEKTQEGVKVAQQNKELGIKVSSTMRMAVDLAIAQTESKSILDNNLTLEEKVLKWRKWLWLEWDKNDTDFPPF